jgi:response regulator RpfG family c-di-GMP phosphodiesterase
MNYKILIVDDETANLRMLERLFRDQYNVISAVSGPEALELLMQHDVALIISDQRMPVMTGIEFLKRAAEMRPQVVRIILTGYTDVNTLVEAINSGVVYKYFTKPWINEDLQQGVKRALQHYETIKSQHELRLQNERLQAYLKTTQKNFIKVFVDMLGIKDLEALAHSRRTSNYALAIGRSLNIGPDELKQLSLAALLHEIVYICLPNHILRNTTALQADDNQILEKNFEWGLQLLASVPYFEDIAFVIRHQRENWDGSGFPEGLSGEQIPLHSRIIALANAYDDITTPHSLQMTSTHDEAITQLQVDSGKKFDPEILENFSNLNLNGHICNTEAAVLEMSVG